MHEFTGLTIITILFLLASSILVASNRTVDRSARTVFLVSDLALCLIAFIDWFDYLCIGSFPNLRFLHAATMGVTFALAPCIPVAISNTIYPERHVRWITFVLGAHALFELGSVFGGYVFWIDASNVYHRGPLYSVYMVAYTASALYLCVESIRAGRTYQSVSTLSLVAILVCMGVGVGIQVLDPHVRTTWPAVSMAVMLYFQFYTEMVLRTDSLTKLLNRHSYDDFLVRPSLPCTIVVIDVNDFKHVNDTYGHAYGDQCLATIANLVRHAFGHSGLCYRTGGDEYLVVVTERQDEVDRMTERLTELVRKEQAHDARIPGISVGCAQAQEECRCLEDVVAVADQRMYEAKRAAKVGRT